MLYAIAGSQGCGKTTTLNRLKADYGYNVVERKASRSIQAEWGYTLEQINADPELTVKFQYEILSRKQKDDVASQQTPGVWLTERSAGDFITYALVVLGKEPQCSDFLDEYFLQCQEVQKIYDKVFYLTAGHFSVEKDVHRASANQHYCRLIDLAMLDFTKQITDPSKLVIINTPNLHERVRIIRDETR